LLVRLQPGKLLTFKGNTMLDKAIKHKKEKRAPYYKSGKFDRTCRPHGSCPYCQSNRKHSELVRKESAKDKLNDCD
jgi:hypothetical protein